MRSTVIITSVVVLGVFLLFVGAGVGVYLNHVEQIKLDQAVGMITTLADELDTQTTESGAYLKPKGNSFNAGDDPWGNKIKVMYSKGGVSEHVKVVSCGPDGLQGTSDDIVQVRQVTNLSGIGTGLKENIEEFSENGARGATKGVLQGLKAELTPDLIEKIKKTKEP